MLVSGVAVVDSASGMWLGLACTDFAMSEAIRSLQCLKLYDLVNYLLDIVGNWAAIAAWTMDLRQRSGG